MDLFDAIRSGDIETVDTLLHEGADPAQRDFRGMFPIEIAVSSNDLDIVECLLWHGIEINDSRICALFLAGSPEMIDLLVEHGADVNLKDMVGRTALHAVIWHKNCHLLIGRLIESGADVNAKDHDGISPLVLAASDHGSERACAVLRDYEAEWSPPPDEAEGYRQQLIYSLMQVGRSDLIDRIKMSSL